MTDSVGGQAVGKCNFMVALWEPYCFITGLELMFEISDIVTFDLYGVYAE